MAGKTIKGITVEIGADVSGLNKAMKDSDQQVKKTQSELNEVNRLLKFDPENTVLLAQKQELLAKMTEQTSTKMDALKAAREKLSQAENRDEEWAENLRTLDREIASTEISLGKLSGTAGDSGKSLDKLAEAEAESGNAAEKSEGQLKKIAGTMKDGLAASASTAAAAVKAVSDAVVEAGGKMVDTVKDGAAYADNILTLSTNTGLSTAQLQEFQYMAELTDTSVDTITGSLAKLTKNMDSAREGSGSAAEAFQLLGVEIANEDGTLRSNQEVFGEVIDALGSISNETERDAASMAIFGKSAQDLNSFIAQGSEGIAAFAQEARDMGYVLDDETLASLGAADDAFQRFTNAGTAAKNMAAAALAPALTDIANDVLPQVADGIQSVSEGFSEGGLTGALDAVMGVVGTVADGIINALPGIASTGTQIVLTLVTWILASLPNVAEAGIGIIVSLIESIADSLPDLIPAAVDMVLKIVDTLTRPDTLLPLADAALDLILALAEGLIEALPALVEKAPEIISNLIHAILIELPRILAAGAELAMKLAEGLGKAGIQLALEVPGMILNLLDAIAAHWGSLLDTGAEILNQIREGFAQKILDARRWGEDLIDNFLDGIKAKWEALKTTISNVANTVKSFLGFSEPEEGPLSNFHTFAPDMMKLFAQGIRDNAHLISDQIDRAFDFGPMILDGAETGMAAITGPSWAANSMRPVTAAVDAQGLSGALSDALKGCGGRGPVYVSVSFEGSLAQLGRVLQPHVTAETDRRGESFTRR